MSGLPITMSNAVSLLSPAVGAKPPGIDSAVALNDHQIRIFSSGNGDSVLRALADPAFAMVDGLAFEDTVAAGGSIDLPVKGTFPPIELRFPLPGDVRDALDRGADLIVTRDPALLEYAGRRAEFTLHPLPWSRTYVLVQPPSAQPVRGADSEGERQSLARDAVRADARGAEPPFWWLGSSCPADGSRQPTSISDRIVYPREDPIARALAERLVALAAPGNRLRAAALEQSLLSAALRDGSERAYVVSVPRQPLQPCRELQNLPIGARILPLIDSRAHAIIRRGAPPLTVEWDGTIRVVRP